jgi:hypothetical protein
MHQFFLACVCIIFFTFTQVQAQTVNSAGLLKQILELPAPPPVNAEVDRLKKERPPGFYDADNIPPDDAPIEDLLDYWEKQNSAYDEFRYNQRPSRETLQRILGEVEKDPSRLPNYLKLLPPEPEAAELVKRIYQAENQAPAVSDEWLGPVRLWLRNNSDMFLDELAEAAQNIKFENGFIRDQEDLIALAQVDWDRARAIIEKFESTPKESELYTLAKYVLYHHAVKAENSEEVERYRGELKTLVENKKGTHKSRDLAMDALVLGGDYPGREDWYYSLLEDETLLELQENGFTGLTTLVRFMPNERDKWLPAMLRLLDGNNPTLRSVAARNILQISGFGDPELLKKLLPWLTNPQWARESRENERQELIRALGETEIPESVPALIAIVSNPADEYRMDAAKALVKYRSVEAVTVLRRLLLSEDGYEMRGSLIEALVALGGFSDDELIDGLEAFIVYFIEKQKQRDDSEEEKPVPVEVSLGMYLREYETPTNGLVGRTIERIKALRKTNPPAAQMLLDIMEKWDHPLVDLEMLGWMTSDKSNSETVLKLLTKRVELRERVPNELSALREKGPVMRGLGSVILEDETDLANDLRTGDAETRTALLAFARLVRVKLPVDEVAPLLKNDNKLLALAAERYLESEDSVAARTIILSEFKAETRILGAHQSFVPAEKADFEALQELLNNLFRSVGNTAFLNIKLERIKKTEKDLRRELTESPDLVAIFGFIENHSTASKIVRLYKNKIVFTFNEDDARYWEKTLTPKEFEALNRFLIEQRIDELAPFDVEFGSEYPAGEFLMFGRDGGRRVFYQGYSKPKRLSGLAEMFDAFNQGERRLRYRLSDKIGGLEVLLADENLTAATVWKNKADFRVLIEDLTARKMISEELDRQEKLDTTSRLDELIYQRQKERRAAAAYRHFSWRDFSNGKLGAEKIDEPSEIKYLANNRQGAAYSYRYAEATEPISFRRQTVDGEIVDFDGDLFKISGGGAKTVFKDGTYANPVVSADKKWIVAAQAEDSFYNPNRVVRINLQTGREYPVNLPPADEFYPVANNAAQNKVLLYRAKDERYNYQKNNPSPKTPEYYLLDPNTGGVQPVKGEFRPLEQQTFRGLQPASAPNEFWAAIHNEKEHATEIGFYNTLGFSFKPLIKLPEIKLDSMDIWIDEAAAKIYFVYEGHLLAVPLKKTINN